MYERKKVFVKINYQEEKKIVLIPKLNYKYTWKITFVLCILENHLSLSCIYPYLSIYLLF